MNIFRIFKSNIKIIILRNKEEFHKYNNEVLNDRQHYEKILTDRCYNNKNKKIDVKGYCDVCEKQVNFELDFTYSDNITPNYRERLVCPNCKLNNRKIFIMYRIKKFKRRKVYMYEQSTYFYKKSGEFIKNITGSEYLDFKIKSGDIINGIRHEDACNLSFKDNSFDIIVSNDVFEHVTDIKKCFSEALRVLRNGGKIIFSIPFYIEEEKTTIRAKIENSNIIHIKEPQYHGNPISDEGSLVFYDFGWDLIELINNIGFKDVYMLDYYSEENAYIGGGNYIFEAIK